MAFSHDAHEVLNASLNDEAALRAYQAPFDSYTPGLVPRLLGAFLVGSGNLFYGARPSYLKFRAVEVIARVPYHSWASAAFTLLTLTYADEKRAMRLGAFSWFSTLAASNETMHVVVISKLARRAGEHSFVRGTLIPTLFAFFYFWASYVLYLFSPRASLELNYLFEQHAFMQYSVFLREREKEMKTKKLESAYFSWYGRAATNEYEFFRSVRNDELIHRNVSIQEIAALKNNS